MNPICCNQNMTQLNHVSSDAGDVVQLFWCPSCGKLLGKRVDDIYTQDCEKCLYKKTRAPQEDGFCYMFQDWMPDCHQYKEG